MAKRGGGCIRVGLLVVLIPILFGLGVLLVSNLNRVLTHDTTQGTIVELVWGVDSDGDSTATPVYEYVVEGLPYRYESGVSYGGLLVPNIGDTRTILYNPADPTDARVRNIFLLVWLPIILMAIPLLIAGFVFWRMARRRRMSDVAPPWADQIPGEQPQWNQPQQHGTERQTAPGWQAVDPSASQVIEAIFMGTEPSQMDDQGRVRYRVKARAELAGEIHRFRSEWMDEDPTLYYMQHGNKVDVRVSSGNPADYEVILPPSG
ncbi:MAG: DUF3592 domain-containing protein [bacterium]|nr:DUF3592 domain-containing protein [bacterium]